MEANNKPNYTSADKAAVKILRDLYMQTEASDVLFNARMYLQDRTRYEKLFKADAARFGRKMTDRLDVAR